MTPILLIYLFLVDLVFMLVSSIGTPVMIVYQFAKCGSFDSHKLDQSIDKIFEKLLGL